MDTDYARLKNPELEAMLKKRGLPHAGKKSDMIKRLEDDDKTKKPDGASKPSESASAKPATKPAPAVASPAKPSPAPATATASSPKKPAPKPAAATTAAATTTSTSTDTKSKPAATGSPTKAKAAPAAKSTDPTSADAKPTESTTAPADTKSEEPKPAPQDYTFGLASTDIDEELAKRKARAKKFGIVDNTDSEAIKNLERQKRFGTGAPAEGGEKKDGVSRLDQALPERRKRGRAAEDVKEDAGESYEDPGLKRRRGGGGGRGRGGRERNAPRGEKKANGGPSWMSEADRAAAGKRKAKFATK